MRRSGGRRFGAAMVNPMRQPQSIRFHLTAVFLLFFLLVVVLGMFSIWRLSNFNRLSADVAEVWLPNTRALGDLNNFTSDFRAIEGSNLLVDRSGRAGGDRTADGRARPLDRRGRARLRAHPARCRRERVVRRVQAALERISDDWSTRSRRCRVPNRKAEALAIYARRVARRLRRGERHARSIDRSGGRQRPGRQRASRRRLPAGVLADRARHASSPASWWWPRSSISAVRFRRRCCILPTGCGGSRRTIPTSISRKPGRRDEIGEMAQATVVFRNNAIELMRSQRTLARQAAMLEEQLAQEQRLALAQRNFVSMASHEFRTPLTIIDGHARRLEKTREGALGARDRRARRQDSRRRAAADAFDRQSAQFRAPDRRRRRAIFRAGRDGPGGVAARGLPAAPRNGAGGARSSSASVTPRCRSSATPSCCSRCSAIFSPTPSNIRRTAAPIEVEAAIDGDEAVVAITDRGIGIPPAISIGCSSAIIAAATCPASSEPASGFIWSRWPSTCTKAESRWRARKAMDRVLSFACRSSVLRRHHAERS